jgi:anti-sigma factor RsiW
MTALGRHPGTAELCDYVAGDLSVTDADAVEEHLFECPVCAAELESIERLRVAVRDTVRDAAVGANVNRAFLDRAVADGLSLRQYRLEPGTRVACSAGPEDLFVVRLAADFSSLEGLRLRVGVENLDSGESQTLPTRRVDADRSLGEVVLVFPGAVVRSYPRSLWSLVVEGELGSGDRGECGPFVLDHSP